MQIEKSEKRFILGKRPSPGWFGFCATERHESKELWDNCTLIYLITLIENDYQVNQADVAERPLRVQRSISFMG